MYPNNSRDKKQNVSGEDLFFYLRQMKSIQECLVVGQS